MTTTHPRENVAGSAPEHQGGPTGPAQWQPAVLRVTRQMREHRGHPARRQEPEWRNPASSLLSPRREPDAADFQRPPCRTPAARPSRPYTPGRGVDSYRSRRWRPRGSGAGSAGLLPSTVRSSEAAARGAYSRCRRRPVGGAAQSSLRASVAATSADAPPGSAVDSQRGDRHELGPRGLSGGGATGGRGRRPERSAAGPDGPHRAACRSARALSLRGMLPVSCKPTMQLIVVTGHWRTGFRGIPSNRRTLLAREVHCD
jgi:hypothetical protein